MYTIEQMIPHRGRMKLVQEVIEVNGDRCVTAATVSPEWPTFENGSVSPLVLIELVAQTKGVNIGWQELHSEKPSGKVGWIVGVRRADFYRDLIPVDTRIQVTIEGGRNEGSYAVIAGSARAGSELLGEIELQVFRPEQE